MVDEKRLVELRNDLAAGKVVPVGELMDTVEVLWGVARAARRWTLAGPGKDSVNAEQVLVDKLQAVRELGEGTS